MNSISRRLLLAIGVMLAVPAAADPLPMTQLDFKVPGTQVGDLPANHARSASECRVCHGGYSPQTEPYSTWAGSLMALGGRDPAVLRADDHRQPGRRQCRQLLPALPCAGGGRYRSCGAGQWQHAERDRPGRRQLPLLPQHGRPAIPGRRQSGRGSGDPGRAGTSSCVLRQRHVRARSAGPSARPARRCRAAASRRWSHPSIGAARCAAPATMSAMSPPRASPTAVGATTMLNAPAPDANPQGQFPLERTYTEWKLSCLRRRRRRHGRPLRRRARRRRVHLPGLPHADRQRQRLQLGRGAQRSAEPRIRRRRGAVAGPDRRVHRGRSGHRPERDCRRSRACAVDAAARRRRRTDARRQRIDRAGGQPQRPQAADRPYRGPSRVAEPALPRRRRQPAGRDRVATTTPPRHWTKPAPRSTRCWSASARTRRR